jgi:hypothetical protein
MKRWFALVFLALCVPRGAAAQAAAADGWVVLPIEEYRALRTRAFPVTPDPAPPPLDATLTRVEYTLSTSGENVVGQARLTIDVLKQGWGSVQVPPGVLVRGATLDGRATALVHGDPPRVLLPRAGRTVLSLDIALALGTSAGTESITLPSAGSALTLVTFTIPRTGVDLSVGGGFLAEQRETQGSTQFSIYGAPGRPLTLVWKRRVDDRRGSLPVKTRARITQLVALGEDSTQITTNVLLEVTQGQARELIVAVPAGVIVNQVSGASVADWSVNAGNLTIVFLDPVTSDTSVIVASEARLPRDGALPVPLLRVPAADRETGGVAVDVIGAGEIGDRQPRGMEPADVSDLGEIVAGRESPSMAAFRFSPQGGVVPRSLTVKVSRYTPDAVLVANVEEAYYDVLLGEDGKLLVRARYAVRNNQRSFLGVKLPPQALLWSAALAGRPIRPGLSADGAVLLPLRKERTRDDAPAFVVELVYLQRVPSLSEKGTAHVELPAVDLPISRTGVTLQHSPRFTVELATAGAFRSSATPGPWSPTLQNVTAAAEALAAPLRADRDEKDFKMLTDRLTQEAGRIRQGVMPVSVAVPAFGPAMFLASELTAESQPASFNLEYQKTGGRR